MISPLVETISHDGEELAIIIKNEYSNEGIRFFSDPEYSQQVAFMQHKAGHVIQPHMHKEVLRSVRQTNEVLIIKSGKVKVTIYTKEQVFFCERELSAGDLIFLIAGGHGFQMLENAEFIEVKQGPYAGDEDKVRF